MSHAYCETGLWVHRHFEICAIFMRSKSFLQLGCRHPVELIAKPSFNTDMTPPMILFTRCRSLLSPGTPSIDQGFGRQLLLAKELCALGGAVLLLAHTFHIPAWLLRGGGEGECMIPMYLLHNTSQVAFTTILIQACVASPSVPSRSNVAS